MPTQYFAIGLTAAAVLAALPVAADNRSRVEAFALADGTFEVVAQFSEDALYWCGASVAARAVAASTDRLYVLQGPGPSSVKPGKRAVVFGLTPPPGATRSGFSNAVDVVGNSLTVTQAEQTCNERSASG